MHEADVVHGQREAVGHARPHKVSVGDGESQQDGDEKEAVCDRVKLIPHAREVERQLVLQRLGILSQDLREATNNEQTECWSILLHNEAAVKYNE